MKNLVACFGWGALLKKKKKVVGHFSIFRYSTWTKEINISSRGSKPQGYIYMKKTPRVRESSTFQERGTGEVTMPRHSGWRGKQSSSSVLVRSPKSQAVSWALLSPDVKYKKEWKLVLFYVYQRHKEIRRKM